MMEAAAAAGDAARATRIQRYKEERRKQLSAHVANVVATDQWSVVDANDAPTPRKKATEHLDSDSTAACGSGNKGADGQSPSTGVRGTRTSRLRAAAAAAPPSSTDITERRLRKESIRDTPRVSGETATERPLRTRLVRRCVQSLRKTPSVSDVACDSARVNGASASASVILKCVDKVVVNNNNYNCVDDACATDEIPIKARRTNKLLPTTSSSTTDAVSSRTTRRSKTNPLTCTSSIPERPSVNGDKEHHTRDSTSKVNPDIIGTRRRRILSNGVNTAMKTEKKTSISPPSCNDKNSPPPKSSSTSPNLSPDTSKSKKKLDKLIEKQTLTQVSGVAGKIDSSVKMKTDSRAINDSNDNHSNLKTFSSPRKVDRKINSRNRLTRRMDDLAALTKETLARLDKLAVNNQSLNSIEHTTVNKDKTTLKEVINDGQQISDEKCSQSQKPSTSRGVIERLRDIDTAAEHLLDFEKRNSNYNNLSIDTKLNYSNPKNLVENNYPALSHGPISILKRKQSQEDTPFSGTSIFTATPPVTFSPSVIEPRSRHSRQTQGILKKRRSFDESHVSRRRSCSPEVTFVEDDNGDFKPILKSQRRSSLEEVIRTQSPETIIHSILKRKFSREEEINNEDRSLGSPEPQGILKRKSNSSSSSSTTSSHVSIAQAVILAAAGGAELINEDREAVRPILKKKSFSEERPCVEVLNSDAPKPILKKKSLTELDDHEYDRPKKPILKSSRRVSHEDDYTSSFDLSEEDHSSRRSSLFRSRASDHSGSECESAVRPILKQRGSSRSREQSQSPRQRLSFCSNDAHSTTENDPSSSRFNSETLQSPTKVLEMMSALKGEQNIAFSDKISGVRRRNLRNKKVSRSKSLASDFQDELTTILNHRRTAVDETTSDVCSVVGTGSAEEGQSIVSVPIFPSIADKIRLMERYMTNECEAKLQIGKKIRSKERYKTQPVTMEELQSSLIGLDLSQDSFQSSMRGGALSTAAAVASIAPAFSYDQRDRFDSLDAGVDLSLGSSLLCFDSLASADEPSLNVSEAFDRVLDAPLRSVLDTSEEFDRLLGAASGSRCSELDELDRLQQELASVRLALDADSHALDARRTPENLSVDSGVFNRLSSGDSGPMSAGDDPGLCQREEVINRLFPVETNSAFIEAITPDKSKIFPRRDLDEGNFMTAKMEENIVSKASEAVTDNIDCEMDSSVSYENCRFLPGLVKSNSVSARASMWQQLQEQAKGAPKPVIRRNSRQGMDGSILERFKSQSIDSEQNDKFNPLSQSQSSISLSLEHDEDAKLDEDDPAKLSLSEKMKMFNAKLARPPGIPTIPREMRTARAIRFKTMPVQADLVTEAKQNNERLNKSDVGECLDYGDFAKRREVFARGIKQTVSASHLPEIPRFRDGIGTKHGGPQVAVSVIPKPPINKLNRRKKTAHIEHTIVKGESSEGLKDEGIDSSSNDDVESHSSRSMSDSSCSSSDSSDSDAEFNQISPSHRSFRPSAIKPSKTDSDIARTIKDKSFCENRFKLPCSDDILAKKKLQVSHDSSEKENQTNAKWPKNREKKHSPIKDDPLRKPVNNKRSSEVENTAVKNPLLGFYSRGSLYNPQVIQELKLRKVCPQGWNSAHHGLTQPTQDGSGSEGESSGGREVRQITSRRRLNRSVVWPSRKSPSVATAATADPPSSAVSKDQVKEWSGVSAAVPQRALRSRSQFSVSSGAVSAKRRDGTTNGNVLPPPLMRCATQPDAAMPLRQGGSIAERLAALQQSGANDWRKRISRLSPDEDEVTAIEATKNKINDSLNGKIEDKKLTSIEAPDLSGDILADRRHKLEHASQGWKKRVGQHDAAMFSVAGRMERDLKGTSFPSGPTIIAPIVPDKVETPLLPAMPVKPPLTPPLSDQPKSPAANRFRSRRPPTVQQQNQASPSIGPLRSTSMAVVAAPSSPVDSSSSVQSPQKMFKRSQSVSEVEALAAALADEGQLNGSQSVSVPVPRADDETFTSFFTSASHTVNSLTSNHLHNNNNLLPIPDEIDLDAIDSGSRHLLGAGARRVRQAGRRGSRNPIRALAARTDLRQEYTQLPSAGIAARETKNNIVEKISSSAGLAQEALAGLASREDFSAVHLRSAATPVTRPLAPHTNLMLLHIKGRRKTQVRLVEPIYVNINAGDCFVLVTPDHVFHYAGYYSNVIERSRSADIALHVHNTKDLGCKNSTTVITIDELTKNYSSKHWNLFWNYLGLENIESFKPSGAGHVDEDEIYETSIVQTNMCYELIGDELVPIQEYWGQVPKISMLDPSKIIVFDFGSEMYVWNGKNVHLERRRLAAQLAKEMWDEGYDYQECHVCPLTITEVLGSRTEMKDLPRKATARPSWAILAKVTQHMETILFREKFLDWPDFTRVIKVKEEQDNMKGSTIIKPCDVTEMWLNEYEDPSLVLENSHVGRGTHYYDKESMRHFDVKTKSVTKWIIQEYDYQIVDDEDEIGEFYSGDSYIIRWEYQITVSGRELNGKPSKHTTTGRDRCAYFCWQGKDASANERGAAALLTVELDKEKGPQVRVSQGTEPPAFLNLFQGGLIIHQGKRGYDQNRYRLYVSRGNTFNESYLVQVPCSMRQLRSRASMILVDTKENQLYVWHGIRSLKHTKNVALDAAKNIAIILPKALFSSDQALRTIEVKEGAEPRLVLEALGGENRQLYHSLLGKDSKSGADESVTPRLFHFTDISGQFEATEMLSSLRHPTLITPFPFSQKELYDVSQPALFLLDDGNSVWIWQGWRPTNEDDESDVIDRISVDAVGAKRWQSCRRAALSTAADYWRLSRGQPPVGDPPSSPAPSDAALHLVAAGLEPLEFTNMFDAWEDRDDIAEINIMYGLKPCWKGSIVSELSRMVGGAEGNALLLPPEALKQRPLPDDVDPAHLEEHLSADDFKKTFNMTKEEFKVLPSWKQANLKKDLGLF